MRAILAALTFVTVMTVAATSTPNGGRTPHSGAFYLHELKASILQVLEQNQALVNDGGARPKSSKLLPDAVFARTYDLFSEVVGDDFSIGSLAHDPAEITAALGLMLQSGRVTIARLQREIDAEPDGAIVAGRFPPDEFVRQVGAAFGERTGIEIVQTEPDVTEDDPVAIDARFQALWIEDPSWIRVSIPAAR